MTKMCFFYSICRLFEPTHCLVPYAGSGMPFEKYGTDANGVGCTGSNCRPTVGGIKPRLEVKRGLESKYKNQYVTRVGERSQSACVVNADSMNSGWWKGEFVGPKYILSERVRASLKKGDENTYIICIKNRVLCDGTPFGLVKSDFSETLVNRLCTIYVA